MGGEQAATSSSEAPAAGVGGRRGIDRGRRADSQARSARLREKLRRGANKRAPGGGREAAWVPPAATWQTDAAGAAQRHHAPSRTSSPARPTRRCSARTKLGGDVRVGLMDGGAHGAVLPCQRHQGVHQAHRHFAVQPWAGGEEGRDVRGGGRCRVGWSTLRQGRWGPSANTVHACNTQGVHNTRRAPMSAPLGPPY